MAIMIVIDTILTYHYTLKGDIWLKNLREKEKEKSRDYPSSFEKEVVTKNSNP